ncbi:MAG: hypothetical protein E6043_01745, partial [Slackia sp.]|nr:hypothetical protein [Slackia sp.]
IPYRDAWTGRRGAGDADEALARSSSRRMRDDGRHAAQERPCAARRPFSRKPDASLSSPQPLWEGG